MPVAPANRTFSLGSTNRLIVNGNKLRNPTITVRKVLMHPGKAALQDRFWLVTEVSDADDVSLVGEVLVTVLSRSVADHETFVTVESGIRQGSMGAANVVRSTNVDTERSRQIEKVRKNLLQEWEQVKKLENKAGLPELMLEVVNDMSLVRSTLRRSARNRVAAVQTLQDKLGRYNPNAASAAITAAMARFVTVASYDVITKKSMSNRFSTFSAIAEHIDATLWDLEVILGQLSAESDSFKQAKLVQRKSAIIAKKLDLMHIKPYFWVLVWAENHLQGEYHEPKNLEQIILALKCEQILGQIDMLCSEMKRSSDKAVLRSALRIASMNLSGIDNMPTEYSDLFVELRKYVRRYMALRPKMDFSEFAKHAEHLQAQIRYRSQEPGNAWRIRSCEHLFEEQEASKLVHS